MTEAELAPRRRVWIAMADLFLDTDVRIHYIDVVRVLAASPYSLDELWTILDQEVTPALQSNLMQVAGEWAMFPDDWVVEQVEPRAGKRRWLPNVVDMKEDWRVLAALIRRIRELPDDESRKQRLDVWQVLMMDVLLGENPTPHPERCPGVPVVEMERILREELMPELRATARTDAEDNWRRFRETMNSNGNA